MNYFHYITDEPPIGRRIVPVDADGRDIDFIPVTMDMLVSAAERGAWHHPYPQHRVQNRWWVNMRQFAYGVLALGVVFGLLHALS